VFQLQIAGLNGAFLTGDLFNLFVFFEILLLASYALLVHGGGRQRARAGLAYVVLNLVGSALFLVALGLLYGTLGTLNLADMALVFAGIDAADQAPVRAAAALLVSVFLLKAALLPLSFWLPHVYGAAVAPVAALFAIMTKVGIYALLRVSAIGLAAAPFTADLLAVWLPALAVLTIAVGAIGALAAERFVFGIANIVLVSTGTLQAAVAAGNSAATAAALYYLPHTTFVTAGLFLLGDAIAGQRGDLSDTMVKGPRLAVVTATGGAFLVLALAASGVPPLSGFLGKLMLMQSLRPTPFGAAIWAALLISGLMIALVLARAASVFFWEPGRADGGAASPAATKPANRRPLTALLLLAVTSPALAAAAAPVGGYVRAAAEQLHARQPYVTAVLGTQPDIRRERRP
jgi:multicomponent K+:H+ antiporter subunit D